MILYIDTTDYKKATFALLQISSRTRSVIQINKDMDSRLSTSLKLRGEGSGNDKKKVFKKSYKINPYESCLTLKILDEFFKNFKIKNPEFKIKKIVVNKGPGSYTGVRVGATIAQALGFAWNIPVKFLSKDKFVI